MAVLRVTEEMVDRRTTAFGFEIAGVAARIDGEPSRESGRQGSPAQDTAPVKGTTKSGGSEGWMPTIDEIRMNDSAPVRELDMSATAAGAAVVLPPAEQVLAAPASELSRILQSAVKRTFDVLVSATVLLVTLPLIA